MAELKFAVLIDGDNSSSKYIGTINEEMAKEGIVTYKRIYGDWTQPNLTGWKEVLLENAITPVQQYGYTSGKNATDSAMIIDAMDILYTGKVDGFCLVSSDSDFTKLATRLREAGMVVIGMGRHQTPQPFVKACSRFKYMDLISEEAQSKGKKDVKEKAEKDIKQNKKATKELKPFIDKIIDENADADGWVLASTIGTLLQKQFVDFDSRNYGCKKTIDLLKQLKYSTKVSEDKTTWYISKKKVGE